jgi:hypothetical protein
LDKKLSDDSSNSLVLDKAISLSSDLVEEEEQRGSEDHKDLNPLKTKPIRVVKRRKSKAPVQFSTRLKSKKNQG